MVATAVVVAALCWSHAMFAKMKRTQLDNLCGQATFSACCSQGPSIPTHWATICKTMHLGSGAWLAPHPTSATRGSTVPLESTLSRNQLLAHWAPVPSPTGPRARKKMGVLLSAALGAIAGVCWDQIASVFKPGCRPNCLATPPISSTFPLCCFQLRAL